MSVGTLYQYFPDKDAILVALAAQHVDHATSLLEAMVNAAKSEAKPLRELLTHLVQAVIHEHRGGSNLHRVLFEHGPMPTALASHLEAADGRIRVRVAELLQLSPEVTVDDLDCAAFLVVQVVDAMVHRFLLHPPEGVPLDCLVTHLVEMIFHYLTGHRDADLLR